MRVGGPAFRSRLLPLLLSLAAAAVAATLFYQRSTRAPVGVVGGCGEPAAIYVSPNGSDRWSGRLPEPSPSGDDGPVATIERALQLARQARAEGRAARIVLRGGVYRVEKPIVLTPEDSGGPGCPLVIEAYPGEVPVISGGVLLGGFGEAEVNGRRVLVATVPSGLRFRQLFVNGGRRPRARLPKEGFFRVVEVPAYRGRDVMSLGLFEGADSFVCRSGDIQPWRNLEDAEVVLLHFWIEERIPIASFDYQANLVRLKQRTVFVIRDGFTPQGPRYYVENVFEALSEPGEWYLDWREGKLYYIPLPGESAASVKAVAPAVKWRLLELRGDPQRGRYVEHIVVRGLVFEHADWDYVLSPQAAVNVPGAIYVEGARDVTFENCTVRHVGGYAIEVGPGSRGVRVVNCELYDLGAGGVKVGTQHLPRAEWERVEFVDVEGNHIHECGLVFHSAVGVWVGQARFVRVVRNRIHDLYYTGVSVGWTWGYGESFASYNLVEGNVIHDIGKGLLSDMGGIYTLGVQPGTAVRCNLIYNVSAYQYGGWGVYLDEGSSYITVEGNVVHDTSHACFHQHYGRNNVVRDNVFAFCGEGAVQLSRGEPGYTAFAFERNIVLTIGTPVFLGGYAQDFSSRNIVSDRNAFWDLSGTLVLCREQRSGRTYTLEEWRALGYDQLSLIEDPRFANPQARDFRLREDSPLRRLGFKELCTLSGKASGNQ